MRIQIIIETGQECIGIDREAKGECEEAVGSRTLAAAAEDDELVVAALRRDGQQTAQTVAIGSGVGCCLR